MADPTTDLGGPEKPDVAKMPDSPFDRLKAKHKKVRRARKPLELDIPGYDGELVAKYRVQEVEEIQLGEQKVEEEEAAGAKDVLLNGAMDNISRGCIGIFLRVGDELVPLNEYKDEYGDEPVRFDSRLADFFEVEAETAREIIRDRFPEDLAITDHSTRINVWMRSGVEADAADF